MISEPVELAYPGNAKSKAIRQNATDRNADEECNGLHENLEVASGCSHSGAKKKSNHRRELTLEDICNNPDDFDDDEEDDSDWEPFLEHLAIRKWFCTNCTMLNLDGMIFCEMCKEHKESGILKHGFFGSPASQGAALTPVELEVIERYTKKVSKLATAKCSTAIGFDERLLLHSESMLGIRSKLC